MNNRLLNGMLSQFKDSTCDNNAENDDEEESYNEILSNDSMSSYDDNYDVSRENNCNKVDNEEGSVERVNDTVIDSENIDIAEKMKEYEKAYHTRCI